MRVLGIDPGTATTGFGLVREIDGDRLEAIAYGVISTPSGIHQGERLSEIYNQLQQILLLHRPDFGAVEKLFFQRNVTNALTVGQARGVCLLAMSQAGLEIAEYSPMEVKLAVAGYGGADKNQVQQMVKVLLELPEIPRPDDAADALAIAICHIHSNHFASLSRSDLP